MARGSVAKENLINKFIKDNPKEYIGLYDKKYYFWAEENGEKVQIAISLTCPKTPVTSTNNIPINSSGDLDFTSNEKSIVATSFEPVEISEEEKNNIKSIMEKLGL